MVLVAHWCFQEDLDLLEGVDEESLSEIEFEDSSSSQGDLCEEEVSGHTPLRMHLNPMLED